MAMKKIQARELPIPSGAAEDVLRSNSAHRLRNRRRRCKRILVMQASQHRFRKHECTRR